MISPDPPPPPQGTEAVVGSADHGLKVFALDTCKQRRNLYTKKFGHTEWVTTCCYLPDGRIVSGGAHPGLKGTAKGGGKGSGGCGGSEGRGARGWRSPCNDIRTLGWRIVESRVSLDHSIPTPPRARGVSYGLRIRSPGMDNKLCLWAAGGLVRCEDLVGHKASVAKACPRPSGRCHWIPDPRAGGVTSNEKPIRLSVVCFGTGPGSKGL